MLGNQMENEVLKSVCGGNGYVVKDIDPKHSMYELGQTVEIINFTNNGERDVGHIVDKKFENGYWIYYVKRNHPHKRIFWLGDDTYVWSAASSFVS